MAVVADLLVDSNGFRLGRVVSGESEATRFELAKLAFARPDSAQYFWVIPGSDHDRESFETTVRNDPRVEALIQFDSTVGRTLYRMEWSNAVDGLFEEFERNGIVVESAFGSTVEWHFRLQADTNGALDAFSRRCSEKGISLTLDRATPGSTTDPSLLAALTENQRAAIVLAIEMGYFNVPRDSQQAEVAEEIGISSQAFSRLLRRALSTLLEEVSSSGNDG